LRVALGENEDNIILDNLIPLSDLILLRKRRYRVGRRLLSGPLGTCFRKGRIVRVDGHSRAIIRHSRVARLQHRRDFAKKNSPRVTISAHNHNISRGRLTFAGVVGVGTASELDQFRYNCTSIVIRCSSNAFYNTLLVAKLLVREEVYIFTSISALTLRFL